MRFPVAWAVEVCQEADRVLRDVTDRIQDDQIDGTFWAAWVYERATSIVRDRRSART